MNTKELLTVDELASDVRLKKDKLRSYKRGYLIGAITYDDLAGAGKELSSALYKYMKAKFPKVKTKRVHYTSLIQ